MKRLFGVNSCPEFSKFEFNLRTNIFHQNRSYGDFVNNGGFMTRALRRFMISRHLRYVRGI